MKIKDTDYLYATMRVRANEKNLLTERDISRMCDAKTASEAAKILSDAGYGDIAGGSFSEVSDAIVQMREKTGKLIDEICENRAIFDVFALKYDFHNIKTVIKASLSGIDAERLLSNSGTVSKEDIVSAYQTGDVSALPEKMGEALREARDILSRTGDACLADITLDRAYFEMLADTAQSSGSEFLRGYVALLADIANLRTAVRAARQGRDDDILRRALVPGGKLRTDALLVHDFTGACASSLLRTAAELGEIAANNGGTLLEFERALDLAGIEYMKAARYVAFDERPIIAYIAAREAEEMTVRIIMAGKAEGLSADEIKRRLRV